MAGLTLVPLTPNDFIVFREGKMKKLLDIAAEIVQAQASVGQMSAEQIEQSLIKTFSTLQRMQRAEEKGIFLDRGTAEEIGGRGSPGEKRAA